MKYFFIGIAILLTTRAEGPNQQLPQNTPEGVLLPYVSEDRPMPHAGDLETTITWVPEEGKNYRPEFSDEVVNPTWRAVPYKSPDSGTARHQGSPFKQFYRVLELESGSVVPASLSVSPLVMLYMHLAYFRPAAGWQFKVQFQTNESGPWENYLGSSTGSVSYFSTSGNSSYRILASPPIVREDYEAVLIGGQSNALLFDNESYPEKIDDVLYLNPNLGFSPVSKRDPAAPPLYSYGFAAGAAAELHDTVPRKRLLIPVAVGGTAMEHWLAGAQPFDPVSFFGEACLRRIMATPQPLAAIWYYGHEASMFVPLRETYAEHWTNWVSVLREKMGTVPILFAQVAKSPDASLETVLHPGAEIQRLLEPTLPDHHMVVTFDLPLADTVHLSAEGQEMLGHRFALAMRQHVYKEPINGTGPRLQELAFASPGNDLIAVHFDSSINLCTNNYDGQFQIFDAGQPVAIQNMERGLDGTSVLIQLAAPLPADAMIDYGGIPAQALLTFLPNVVRDQDGLPAPQFGPLGIRPYQ